MMVRKMAVAGSFYPEDPAEIKRYFEHFESIDNPEALFDDRLFRAVIVPHAGYIYSGYTASVAYRNLHASNPKRFVVIGPSHRVAFGGISVVPFDRYETPFGALEGDSGLVAMLEKKFTTQALREVHQEHSTEVQFPFLKYYFPQASLVEIIYGDVSDTALEDLMAYLLQQEDLVVIVSTDLSHFYDLQTAQKLDSICLEAIVQQDRTLLQKGCEACGMHGVAALLGTTKKLGLQPLLFDYRTSADASGESSRVVGYVSCGFEQKVKK